MIAYNGFSLNQSSCPIIVRGTDNDLNITGRYSEKRFLIVKITLSERFSYPSLCNVPDVSPEFQYRNTGSYMVVPQSSTSQMN